MTLCPRDRAVGEDDVRPRDQAEDTSHVPYLRCRGNVSFAPALVEPHWEDCFEVIFVKDGPVRRGKIETMCFRTCVLKNAKENLYHFVKHIMEPLDVSMEKLQGKVRKKTDQ